MPRLPRISGQEAIRALERLGFVQIRQRGSHVVLKKLTPESTVGCTVPLSQQLAIGTLAGILRQAQVTPDTKLRSKKLSLIQEKWLYSRNPAAILERNLV